MTNDLKLETALKRAADTLRAFGHGPLADARTDELRKARAFRDLEVAFRAAPWWQRLRYSAKLAELAALVAAMAEQSARYAQDGTPEWGEPWARIQELALRRIDRG